MVKIKTVCFGKEHLLPLCSQQQRPPVSFLRLCWWGQGEAATAHSYAFSSLGLRPFAHAVPSTWDAVPTSSPPAPTPPPLPSLLLWGGSPSP